MLATFRYFLRQDTLPQMPPIFASPSDVTMRSRCVLRVGSPDAGEPVPDPTVPELALHMRLRPLYDVEVPGVLSLRANAFFVPPADEAGGDESLDT